MALALGQSRRWPLVLASNRDEFHDRIALPLSRWTAPDGTTVMSGRDVQAGGTWLGCTPAGRIALLTNVREGAARAAFVSGSRSRGELPLQWLASAQSSAAFLASTPAHDYAGCNLLMGDSLTGEWAWASNRGHAADSAGGWHLKVLQAGVYGLSNAQLDTPWPKTLALKAALVDALTRAEPRLAAQPDELKAASDQMQARLWSALANRERAAPAQLPNTGVDAELEHGLSSAWVDLPERGYGTRCSSLVWLEAAPSGGLHLHITEKTWTAASATPMAAALTSPLPGR